MDITAIKARLDQLQQATTKTSSLWKPSPGKTQVRIVPYKHNKDNPFIELYFHYDMGERNYLSPISFGRPDPIEEFATKLKTSGNKEDYKLGRKIENLGIERSLAVEKFIKVQYRPIRQPIGKN